MPKLFSNRGIKDKSLNPFCHSVLWFSFISAVETLFISGGYADAILSSSEGVSLSHDLVTCPATADLPIPVSGVSMATIGEQLPVVCAGAMYVRELQLHELITGSI